MKPEFEKLIEQACEQAMLVELNDLPGLAVLSKMLGNIASAFAGESGNNATHQIAGEAARQTAALLENIIFEKSSDPSGELAVVGRCVAALQAVCRGRSLKEAGFPAELSLRFADNAPDNAAALAKATEAKPANQSVNLAPDQKTEASALPVELRAGVDEELFAAYLEQQQSALADLESVMLEFEKERNPELLAKLRRILHTMKGEAGVVGLNDILNP